MGHQTNPDGTSDGCLHALFEDQARQTPDAVAVVFEDRQLTYRELNAQANRLAHCLIDAGVGPEMLVGVCMERSLELVVGILGVLKAGGAYVPLDPEYPAQRLAWILADAAPKVVLTTGGLRRHLPPTAEVLILDDPQMQAALDRSSADDPHDAEWTVPRQSRHPAYVIYTSGSTGTPKGVVVTHWNVARLFSSTRHWFGFGPDDVWTLFHSFAFDFSVWELWGALLHGGRLVVVPWAVTRSPADFLQLLVQQRVTVLNQTPSAFYQLMQADREHPETGNKLLLRSIVFGGEALDLSRLDDWYQRHSDDSPALINMYGITETTVHVTYMALNRELARRSQASLIGRCIPDLRVYVLDEHREPTPIGVPGELYVAGEGVARGYLNRPELTAEKFITDPFSGQSGSRLYRTGDRVRWLSDGNLEFLGRVDAQVKLRGFRIELGEIEATVRAHPQVRQALVLLREDHPGEKRLVAYCVSAPSEAMPSASALRDFLKQKLPEYMVPSDFVILSELPLNPNGKVDRRALPAPDNRSRELAADHVAPRTPIEELLANIWCDVLRLERVSIHDNFFDLGGHSLLATRVVSQIIRECNAQLPLLAIFEMPTIEQLALCLLEHQMHATGHQELDQILAELESMPDESMQGHVLEAGKAVHNAC